MWLALLHACPLLVPYVVHACIIVGLYTDASVGPRHSFQSLGYSPYAYIGASQSLSYDRRTATVTGNGI